MDEIRPALSPEEWTKLGATDREEQWRAFGRVTAAFLGAPDGDATLWRDLTERRHATAALALQGQPFGFDWDDVDRLRQVADEFGPSRRDHLHEIAARIAALLPPRTPGEGEG